MEVGENWSLPSLDDPGMAEILRNARTLCVLPSQNDTGIVEVTLY